MPTRDFDTQRSAALDQLEPIAFGLFGREWACVPVLTPDAFAWVEKVRGSDDADDVGILTAAFGFVGSVVEETAAWERAIAGEVIDGETLLELVAWLVQEYADRYTPTDSAVTLPPEPQFSPVRNRQTVADVEAALANLKVPSKFGRGGEIGGRGDA